MTKTAAPAPPADDEVVGADEMSALLPSFDTVTLVSGTVVRVRKLKSMEMFALIGIVTAGLGDQADRLRLDTDEGDEAFMLRFLALALAALPKAGREAIAFVRMMVEPDSIITGLGASKKDRERGKELTAALDSEMENPEIEDLFTVVEAVVRREAPHLKALGKKLAAMWNVAKITGQIRVPRTSQG